VVEQTIHAHCRIRRWTLHAVNVRSNHVHLVVTADRAGRDVMKQLKAWCSRRLSDAEGIKSHAVARGAGRRRWFTEGGRTILIRDDTQFETAVRYVLDGQ
jgi:REP element-mobilizing transposase RayT